MAHFYLGILTRGRPGDLRRCITSALATANEQIGVVVAFDDDHVGWNTTPEYKGVSRTLLLPRHYYVRGMNALYRFLQKVAADNSETLEHFAVCNDDVEWLAPSWPQLVRETMVREFEDGQGVLELADVDKCATYAGHAGLFARHFSNRLAEPCYTMYCSDTELLVRLRALDKWRFVVHPTHGAVCRHAEVRDALRTEVKRWYESDRELYNERAAAYGWDRLSVRPPMQGVLNAG